MVRCSGLLLLLFAMPLLAQPETAAIRGESPQTRRRLAEAEQKLRAGKSTDALEDLLRILDEAGDDLVPATKDGRSFVAARNYVHAFLSQLPLAVLNSYQDRVQETAQILLNRGRDRRETKPLRELLDKYSNSRPAAQARILLGDLAFERGEFHTAESYWRALLPDSDSDTDWLPALRNQPQIDGHSVKAKLALVKIFQGKSEVAEPLIQELSQAKPPQQTIPTLQQLQNWLTEPPLVRSDTLGSGSWHTLGGDFHRAGRANGFLAPNRLPSMPAWKTELPRDSGVELDRTRLRAALVGAVRSVALHPIVIGKKAYVADAARILEFDLLSGEVRIRFDARKALALGIAAGDLRLPVPYDADFSLSAINNQLIARLGPASLLTPSKPEVNQSHLSVLVCLDVSSTSDPMKIVWTRSPPVAPGLLAEWEGAPIVVDGRVHALFARSEGGRLIHSIACYEGDSSRPIWISELTESPAANGSEVRTRRDLLTQAGSRIIFCSHTGAIVAIDSISGKPAWAYRYPRVQKASATARFRDISPPVAADGRVFVAPNDGEYLHAFEAETGRPIWSDGPIRIDHVLGTASGKVVVVVAEPNRGVRAYDASTGSTQLPKGWMCHDAPDLPTFGRGLLTDDHVFWPTLSGLQILKLSNGLPSGRRFPGPHGNLAFAAGSLLVGTPTALWCYPLDGSSVPPSEVRPALTMIRPVAPAREIPSRISTPALVEESRVENSDQARQSGNRIARLGEHQLVSLNDAGEIIWRIDTMKQSRDWPSVLSAGPIFTPEIYVDDTRILAQTSHKRRFLIDRTSGTLIWDEPTAWSPWIAPPVKWDEAILVADGPAQVSAIDAETGRTRWRYDAGRPASLSGAAACPFVAGGCVMTGVLRNHGVEVDRISPLTGRAEWTSPYLLQTGLFDPRTPAADGQSLFIPLVDRLIALRLDTGRERWSAELPVIRSSWQALMTRHHLVVHPQRAEPLEPLDGMPGRLLYSWLRLPDARRMFGLLATGYEGWHTRSIPIFLFEPQTGALQQRLELAADGPDLELEKSIDELRFRTGNRIYRLK